MSRLFIIALTLLIYGCNINSGTPDLEASSSAPTNSNCSPTQTVNWAAILNDNCPNLSDYGLFSDSSQLRNKPTPPGLPYSLNSELFTDYANKYRYLFIPVDKQINYIEQGIFEFPIGSVLVKVFAIPENTQLATDAIIEVRLLIRRDSGWQLLPYLWEENIQDAKLHLSGKGVNGNLTHNSIYYENQYSIPTYATCRQCHAQGGSNQPIGPKARNLNRLVNYENQSVNQLELWNQLNLIKGLPSSITEIATTPSWRNNTASLQDRAKAYLDINCSHCHNDNGAADHSGLRLEFWRPLNDGKHGVCQGGDVKNIWPGDANMSFIPYRMALTTPRNRMPPFGRNLADVDAVDLIEEWINSMPYQTCR